MRREFALYGCVAVLALGCGSRASLGLDGTEEFAPDADGAASASGGAAVSGSTSSSVGGGTSATGGAFTSTGGTMPVNGGSSNTGGNVSHGGMTSSGGVSGIAGGGSPNAGVGGVLQSGGTQNGGRGGVSAGGMAGQSSGGVGGVTSKGGGAGTSTTAGAGGVTSGGSSGVGGTSGVGGAITCVPTPEVCDALDNNCDGVIDEGSVCPCEQRQFQGHSYLFCKPARRWQAADEYCRDRGYELITLNTAIENAWASSAAYGILDARWWMGFNDVEREGVWAWASGQRVTYTNWDPPDEPNDSGEGEDCGQLNRYYPSATWNDEPCRNFLPFICEEPR